MSNAISFNDFLAVDIRVGKILEIHDFPEARIPSFRLLIDFGPELGVKKSSAHLPKRYQKDELLGKQIIAVVNFPPKQIGPMMSEVLVVGVPDQEGQAILLSPDREVPLGGRLY